MANAQIYRKTIDPSVQDGIDQSLILDPNTFYQKKFDFGDDWTEIKIGFFLSFTDSETDNNKSFVDRDPNVVSGNTTPDTFSWFGIIKDKPVKELPVFGDFIGTRFNALINFDFDEGTRNNLLVDNSAGGLYLYSNITTSSGSIVDIYDTEVSTGERIYLPYVNMGDTTKFATYIGVKIKINNKGLSTQNLTYSIFRQSSTGGYAINSTTDISLKNLINLINLNQYTYNDANLTYNVGGTAIPIPDSFFFYNAFLTVRPRIHAVAVKKIS